MKIALIFTPICLKRNWSTLVAQDRHVGIIPPLSLAYVAAIAERAGHRVQIIDSVAERLSLEATMKRISDYSPDILKTLSNVTSPKVFCNYFYYGIKTLRKIT